MVQTIFSKRHLEINWPLTHLAFFTLIISVTLYCIGKEPEVNWALVHIILGTNMVIYSGVLTTKLLENIEFQYVLFTVWKIRKWFKFSKKIMDKVNLFIKQLIYHLVPQIKPYPNRIPLNKLPWVKTKCWVNKVSCIESVTIFSILLYTNATIYWWSYANQADLGLPIKRTLKPLVIISCPQAYHTAGWNTIFSHTYLLVKILPFWL